MTTPAAHLLKKQNWNITLHNVSASSELSPRRLKFWQIYHHYYFWTHCRNQHLHCLQYTISSATWRERECLRLIFKGRVWTLYHTERDREDPCVFHSVHVFLMIITTQPEGTCDLWCKYVKGTVETQWVVSAGRKTNYSSLTRALYRETAPTAATLHVFLPEARLEQISKFYTLRRAATKDYFNYQTTWLLFGLQKNLKITADVPEKQPIVTV